MSSEELESGATAFLAHLVHSTSLSRLPDATRRAATRTFVNIVGCCIGGAHHDIVETSARALLPYAGAGDVPLFGRAERTDVLTATLLNALSSAAYSFDDTHSQALIHPSGAVAAAVLALAAHRRTSGAQFLLAFTLGIEVACRLSKAVSVAPGVGDIGWSQTGIAAGVGAAAAAARILELDEQRTAWALGIAASQASGFRSMHGSMAASLIFGHAAHTGLRAALLAEQGLTSPAKAIEGQYGYVGLFSSHPHMDYVLAPLGDHFEVEALGYKPYPCGVVIHPALDAALEWHAAQGAQSTAIQHARLHVHPSAMALGSHRHPDGVMQSKVSLYHWVAAALARGQATLAEGRQDVIDDPEVRRLRESLELVRDDAMPVDAVRMTAALRDGTQTTIDIDHCNGSVANPMSDDALGRKFMGQARLHLPVERASRLLSQCWALDSLPDVADIPLRASPNDLTKATP